jgi:hypothetical protein
MQAATQSPTTQSPTAQSPTAAPPTAAQTISMMLKFKTMQAQMDQFTTDVQELQNSVVDVAAAANETGDGVLQAAESMKDIASNAQFNMNETAKLKNGSAEAVSAVSVAMMKTKRLREVLTGLERTATDMGAASAGVGKKVEELENDVKELLPDGGRVQPRLDAAEASLKMYQQEVDNGNVDKGIALTLRKHFSRAKLRVQKLAAEVRLKQLAL